MIFFGENTVFQNNLYVLNGPRLSLVEMKISYNVTLPANTVTTLLSRLQEFLGVRISNNPKVPVCYASAGVVLLMEHDSMLLPLVSDLTLLQMMIFSILQIFSVFDAPWVY
jgi:hypothetical protein